jgi:hypothetical protein
MLGISLQAHPTRELAKEVNGNASHNLINWIPIISLSEYLKAISYGIIDWVYQILDQKRYNWWCNRLRDHRVSDYYLSGTCNLSAG